MGCQLSAYRKSALAASLSEWTKLSAGYELEALRAEQNYHVENWDGASFIPDLDRTSDFTHHRTFILSSLL